jgi:hypothetical protein
MPRQGFFGTEAWRLAGTWNTGVNFSRLPSVAMDST